MYSFLQGVGAAPTGSGTTVAVTITVVAQHAIIGHATMDTTNTTSVTVADNTPTTCNSDVSHNSAQLGQVLLAYSLPNSPGGSRTMTATFGASSSSRGISACEFGGAPRKAGSFVTGTPASNDGGAGTASAYDAATTTTPLVHNALIFEVGESGLHLPTAGGSFQNAFQDSTNNETDAFQILIGGAGTAVASSFTVSAADTWQVVLVAYAPELEPAPLLQALRLGPGRRAPLGLPTPVVPPSSGPIAYTLAAAAAVYTVTGDAAGLFVGRVLSLASGTYTITGDAVSMAVKRLLAAAAGTYTITGKAIATIVARILGAAPGTYVISGKAAGLFVSRVLGVSPGSYVINGKAAGLFVSRVLSASPGTYVISGKAAGLFIARHLGLAAGSYVINGNAAVLSVGHLYTLAAAAGVYTATGDAASLPVARKFGATAGSYAIIGDAIRATRAVVFGIAPGVYAVIGHDVNFIVVHTGVAQLAYWVNAVDRSLAGSPLVPIRMIDFVALARILAVADARGEFAPSLIHFRQEALTVPPLQNQSITGYVAGDKLDVSRIVSAIPTGRTLAKCWMTIKNNATDADPGVIQKAILTSTGAGVGTITAIGDGTGGQPLGTGAFFFEFTPTDTLTTIGAGKTFHYDIQMKFDNGDIATLELGTISFLQGVTQATT